jgi:hypothetical protein
LVAADESVLPLIGAPNRGQGPGLFLVLGLQFIDFVFQVFIAFEHAPESEVAIVRKRWGRFLKRVVTTSLAVVIRGFLRL